MRFMLGSLVDNLKVALLVIATTSAGWVSAKLGIAPIWQSVFVGASAILGIVVCSFLDHFIAEDKTVQRKSETGPITPENPSRVNNRESDC